MPPRLPLAAFVLRLSLLLSLAGLPFAAAAQAVQIDRALSASGGGSRFPADAPARTVSLPDEWARSRPGQTGPVWYRVVFKPGPASERGELSALYIERVCTNLEVYLNGQPVHASGRMEEPITHNCNHPQLVPLPAALLEAGENTIDIKVVGHPLAEVGSRARAGGLSVLRIGPQSDMSWRHAWQTAVNVSFAQSLGATLLLMGGFHAG